MNIIEATHVFIVEPSLNLSAEPQAVGRVHRIGQTKDTFVYRFIIQDTLEVKIHQFMSQKRSSAFLQHVRIREPHRIAVDDESSLTQKAEEASDALWEENILHFQKSRQGRDCLMSLQELSSLLSDEQEELGSPTVEPSEEDIQIMEAIQVEASDKEASRQQERCNKIFWAGLVEFHNRIMSRSDALREIERLHSWDKRLTLLSSHSNTMDLSNAPEQDGKKEKEEEEEEEEEEDACVLFGRKVTDSVFKSLTALPAAEL